MKILRVITSMDPKNGGPCQGIRNSIPIQQKLGIVNEVLTFDSPNANFLGMDNFSIHPIGPSVGPYEYSSALEPWLMNNLGRFDIVIIHGLWLYNSYGTFKTLVKFKKINSKAPKIYVMPHGMLDPYFQYAKERKLKSVRNWVLYKLIESKVINGVDGILFTCQRELMLARGTFRPYHPKRRLNVGYGVQDPPAFLPAMQIAFLKHCVGLNRSYLLFLSRINDKKGVDLLINAYLKLKVNKKVVPQLVIAGPGLETLFGKRMKKLAEAEPDIIFTGMLNGNAKWGAFYGCDAFVLPSHQENFGIAVVEAMACKKPVLISNQVNICDEIRESDAGLIFEDNAEDTYRGLELWLNTPKSRHEEMSKNALELYRSKYTNGQAAKRMIEIINLDSNENL